MKMKAALVLCTLSLFSLVACNKPQESTSTMSPAPEASASPAASASPVASTDPSTTAQYPELLAVVANTKAAVETKDFAKAQSEFDQFEGVWSKVEDSIKAKSADSYDSIESDMDHITAALKDSDADKANTALQELQTHIEGIPKS